MSYLPDYSFFQLMNRCHLTILLDDVKSAKTNVAKIQNKELEIPIEKLTYFNEIKIKTSSSWKEDHLKAMRMAYRDKSYFGEIYGLLEDYFNKKTKDVYQMHTPDFLVYVCTDLIFWVKNYLRIPCDIAFSSKIGFSGFPMDKRRTLMCQSTGTTELLQIEKPTGISIIESMFERGKECLK